MSKVTKTLLYIGGFLLVYGFLCRELRIYFFWDSKSFGVIFLFLVFISYLFDVNKRKVMQGRKTFKIKLAIGFFLIGIIVLPVGIYVFKNSEAYEDAIEQLKKEPELISEIGEIKGFGLMPTGTITTITTSEGVSGTAIFDLTIRGSKKYRDVSVTLIKENSMFWKIKYIE